MTSDTIKHQFNSDMLTDTPFVSHERLLMAQKFHESFESTKFSGLLNFHYLNTSTYSNLKVSRSRDASRTFFCTKNGIFKNFWLCLIPLLLSQATAFLCFCLGIIEELLWKFSACLKHLHYSAINRTAATAPSSLSTHDIKRHRHRQHRRHRALSLSVC